MFNHDNLSFFHELKIAKFEKIMMISKFLMVFYFIYLKIFYNFYYLETYYKSELSSKLFYFVPSIKIFLSIISDLNTL